jgi:hypothetical protein
MKLTTLLGLSLLAGCWSATQPIDPEKPSALDVEVASVSLADDCPDAIVAQEPAASSKRGPSVPSSSSVACAQGYDCSGGARARQSCEQTTLQLSLRSRDDAGARIQIKSVELYDAGGKRLGAMTARNPSRWTEASYLPWNERVDGRQKVTASYALSAPDWSEGSFDPSQTYRVRVVLAIGDEERTLEKPATVSVQAPAHPEPPMVT